jgi:hypothetical protein
MPLNAHKARMTAASAANQNETCLCNVMSPPGPGRQDVMCLSHWPR